MLSSCILSVTISSAEKVSSAIKGVFLYLDRKHKSSSILNVTIGYSYLIKMCAVVEACNIDKI